MLSEPPIFPYTISLPSLPIYSPTPSSAPTSLLISTISAPHQFMKLTFSWSQCLKIYCCIIVFFIYKVYFSPRSFLCTWSQSHNFYCSIIVFFFYDASFSQAFFLHDFVASNLLLCYRVFFFYKTSFSPWSLLSVWSQNIKIYCFIISSQSFLSTWS